jgi:hypothetical protein
MAAHRFREKDPMNKDELKHDDTYRSMRWYEWLVCLLLLLLAGGVRATTVYRCDDGHGNTTFTDQACPAGQPARVVTAAPAPAYAPSPKYAIAAPGDAASAKSRAAHGESSVRHSASTIPAAHSYECRSTDGQVFYRHTACPHSIEAKDDHFGHGHGTQKKVEVHSTRVTREEACAQMHRASASGRSGHANDEVASSYEKNLGHDACH